MVGTSIAFYVFFLGPMIFFMIHTGNERSARMAQLEETCLEAQGDVEANLVKVYSRLPGHGDYCHFRNSQGISVYYAQDKQGKLEQLDPQIIIDLTGF